MKLLRRLLAACIAMMMVMTALPVHADANSGRAMSANEKEAKLSALMSFMNEVHDMKKTCAVKTDSSDNDAYASARIIVKSKAKLDYEDAVGHVSGYNDWHIIQYSTPEEARRACKKYSSMSEVEYAVPDMRMKVFAAPGSNSFKSWGYGANYVDAFSYNEKLYAEYDQSIDSMPEIWVAVIDTGADTTHPFLAGRLVQGYDFVDNDSVPQDGHSHGTHVSGTIVDGTLPNVKVMPIRVLDNEGYGDTVDICAGMEYAYLNGCKVENLSLGGECDGIENGEEHRMMAEMVDAAFDNGTVVCVAAGNETSDAIGVCPANIERVCTVASIDDDYTLSWFSNYGSIVDIAAPGSDILSSVPGGGYGYKSGTSMATPHVSAAAAMVLSHNPDIPADTVIDIMKGYSINIGLTNAGDGMLNVTNLFEERTLSQVANAATCLAEFTSEGNYPWVADTIEYAAKSGNAGINNSSSVMRTIVNAQKGMKIEFEYKVSSAQGDELMLTDNGSTVLRSGNTDGYVRYEHIFNSNGSHVLEFVFKKDAAGAAGSDCAWIRNFNVAHSFDSAINGSEYILPFENDSTFPWVPCEDYVKSSNEGVASSESSMTLTLDMKKDETLSFRYAVSSESNYDMFRFYVNGSKKIEKSGNADWVEYSFKATSDTTYTFEWVYQKDISVDNNRDCAMVDDVVYSGSTVPADGDADANGIVDMNDALLTMRFAIGLVDESAIDVRRADVDMSGDITLNDALMILRGALGLNR